MGSMTVPVQYSANTSIETSFNIYNGPRYIWNEYSIYSSNGLSSSGWVDDAGVRSMTKNSGSWTVDNGSLVGNGSRFSVPVPNSNILVGYRGTISSGWTPNTASDWYEASCLFGRELSGGQRDWGCLIRRTLNPSIGYSFSSISTGSITLETDRVYDIFLLHTGSAYYLYVDNVLACSASYTASGDHFYSMGLFWNRTETQSLVYGKCSKLGIWTFSLNNSDGPIVLPNF